MNYDLIKLNVEAAIAEMAASVPKHLDRMLLAMKQNDRGEVLRNDVVMDHHAIDSTENIYATVELRVYGGHFGMSQRTAWQKLTEDRDGLRDALRSTYHSLSVEKGSHEKTKVALEAANAKIAELTAIEDEP